MPVAISNIIPKTRVELPGVPEPILTAEIYRTLRMFFWESEAWKYTYDNGLDWEANTLVIPAAVAGTDIPAKCVVKRVDNIKYGAGGANWATPIPFKTRDELDRLNPDWRTETGSTPAYWTHDNDVAPAITPQTGTTVSEALLVRAVIAPVFTATDDELPDALYYEFEDYFRAGVLTELMKQPGRDWTNAPLAAYYADQYKRGVIKAKSRAESGYGQPTGVMSYGGI